MKKYYQVRRSLLTPLYALLFIGLQFSCSGQDEVTDIGFVDHLEVFFYQNGNVVDCIDHTLPLFVLVVSPHSERSFYISLSGPNGEQLSTQAFDVISDGSGYFSLDANHFNHKSPLLAKGITYELSEIYENGEQVHLGEITIPLCIYLFSSDSDVEYRQNSVETNSSFYIVNSSGQIIKEISEFDPIYNDLGLNLNPGIYFILENNSGRITFLCRYFQK